MTQVPEALMVAGGIEARTRPDVLIVGAANRSVEVMHRRTAAALREIGLRVTILIDDLVEKHEVLADRHQVDGVDLCFHHIRPWRAGPFAYPSAPAIVAVGRAVARTLDRIRPRLVMTHVDTFSTFRAAQWWARRNGVPGLVVQEGMAAQETSVPAAPPGDSWIRRNASNVLRRAMPGLLRRTKSYHYASHVAVWGDAMRRKLMAEGRSGSTITVTGSPLFDSYDHRLPAAPGSRATVLFVHQYLSDARAEYDLCATVMRACADSLRCRLIVRPHPRGSIGAPELQELARRVTTRPDLISVGDGPDAADYMSSASVLLTMYSAVAYRGLVEGLPLVLADWVRSPFRLEAESYGAAVSVKEEKDLGPALRAALWDEGQRARLHRGGEAMIRDHLFRLDGNAGRRVAQVVARLLETSP